MIATLGLFIVASLVTPDVVPLDTAPKSIAVGIAPLRSGRAPGVGTGAEAAIMVAALNAHRLQEGLSTLAVDSRLCAIARSRASDMVERNYFGHTSPEGVTVFQQMAQANYAFRYAGENLALNQNARAAERAFWESSEHRDNILQPHYVKVGIAAEPSPRGEIFVEDFSD